MIFQFQLQLEAQRIPDQYALIVRRGQDVACERRYGNLFYTGAVCIDLPNRVAGTAVENADLPVIATQYDAVIQRIDRAGIRFYLKRTPGAE